MAAARTEAGRRRSVPLLAEALDAGKKRRGDAPLVPVARHGEPSGLIERVRARVDESRSPGILRPAIAPWRLSYTNALDRFDPDAIVASLSDDVVIRVAVHDEPMQGKQIAQFLFAVLVAELRTIRLTDEIIEGAKAVVLFETRIGDGSAQGLNVIEFDDAALVRDLTVFFRPLAALQLIAQVVGRQMEQRFGPVD